MNIALDEFIEKLKEKCSGGEFRIMYHIRPDGDCIGSTFALAIALKRLGAKVEVTGRDPIPKIHEFMTSKVEMDELSNPIYISVDVATHDRICIYEDMPITFCIDHHRNNDIEAEYKYVEEDCGACSEIILKVIRGLGVEITKDIADLLYTALVTDTMCFRTTDTDRQSFETAAFLASCGADICGIGRRNMFIKSKGRLKIEDILRNSFHFTNDNEIVTGIITLDDLKKADILDSDLEGINSFAEQIEGIKVSVTVRELPDGKSRCSTRTSGDISANEICAVHGGGGHLHAACCVLDVPVEEARKIMEETAAKFV